MNYYQNSKNGYYMNNQNDDRYNNEYYYDNYSKDNNYDNDYNKNNYDHNKKSCCVRRVEETFCCYPSYYNEENKEDKWEDKKEEKRDQCFEGTFKICPKHYDYNDKEDHKDYDDKKDCREKENKKEEHKCGCRCHNRCGFCGLFRRW